MATAELRSSLENFAAFARSLHGDEKSEAQAFLERFFRALGHAGAIEAGATFEFRIAKKPGSAQLELIKAEPGAKAKGGKKFADLLWPERVLIEMKSRGAKLERHYDQAFDYWTHIVPHRPPYVILCNFDEFWIYDFNTQLFDPVDRVSLRELSDRAAAFNFLLPHAQKPVFDNNRVEVTRKAAHNFGEVFRKMLARGEDRTRAQRFILQLLVAVVAEDLGLLPNEIVTSLLAESIEKPEESYNLIGGLFEQMAKDRPATGGRYEGVQYFNGGLFAIVDPVTLKSGEAYSLHDAALRHDWAKVKPEIFGTLFQQSMEDGKKPGTRDERHAFGAHFTSEFDIQKVVGPTIVRPWRERIEACGRDKAKLLAALDDLRRFRVLDPACGSGNFLFVAYREMKRLERDLLARLHRAGAGTSGGTLISGVTLGQFFGMDVLPFAAELAKVTLMLAKELEIREAAAFGQSEDLIVTEKALPLENLDANILCADSLFTGWPAADAIIGNPPYLGAKVLKPTHGADYVNKVRKTFPGVPGMADFCVYWFRKAHDQLAPGGRAGLVGTQNIRNNASRIGGLDYIVGNGGVITDAVSTQVWSGEAAVNVSVVNWIKGESPGDKILAIQRGDSVDSPWETYELPEIKPTLSDQTDVTAAARLSANYEPQVCFSGQVAGHEGFILTPDEAEVMIRAETRNREVIYPFLIGRDMLTGNGSPTEYVIDFQIRTVFEAATYEQPFARVKSLVLPTRQKKAEEGKTAAGEQRSHHKQFLRYWWRHSFDRPELISILSTMPRYIVCSDTTKRPVFEFISNEIRPDHKLRVFAFRDDYSFGILQSQMHWCWFINKCSKLLGRFNYTSTTVFDTFPWPQKPKRGEIAEVAAAAVALRTLRREVMAAHGWSLRDLYRTLDEPGDNPLRTAHARLDTAVRAAYAMPKAADPLAFLLALNLKLAAKEKAGETITPPGFPLAESERDAFTTEDCIYVATR